MLACDHILYSSTVWKIIAFVCGVLAVDTHIQACLRK